MRERAPVGVLKRRLMSLQADVAAAHERLHNTEVSCFIETEYRVLQSASCSVCLSAPEYKWYG